jgi:hypothetical protein
MVGARGFEPPTPRSRTECSTRLSHAPTKILIVTQSLLGLEDGSDRRLIPIHIPIAKAIVFVNRSATALKRPDEQLNALGSLTERNTGKAHPYPDGNGYTSGKRSYHSDTERHEQKHVDHHCSPTRKQF